MLAARCRVLRFFVIDSGEVRLFIAILVVVTRADIFVNVFVLAKVPARVNTTRIAINNRTSLESITKKRKALQRLLPAVSYKCFLSFHLSLGLWECWPSHCVRNLLYRYLISMEPQMHSLDQDGLQQLFDRSGNFVQQKLSLIKGCHINQRSSETATYDE